MGAEVNLDKCFQIDHGWIEGHDDGFGKGFVGRCGRHKSLGHIRDTGKRLENGLGAPVASATEPDLFKLTDGPAQAAFSRRGSFQFGRTK